MLKVGITGGIGCGKSTVSRLMSKLGAIVFDADEEAKKMLDADKRIQEQLLEEFGAQIQNADGTINKQKLASIAFASEDNQAILNAVVHPVIFQEIENRSEQAQRKNEASLFVVDAALIYESGLDQQLDYVVVVTAPYQARVGRALKKEGFTKEEFERRMNLQLPEETKLQQADFVIDNSSSEENLARQVNAIYTQLLAAMA